MNRSTASGKADAQRKQRIFSGFKNLDFYFGGFQKTSYNIVAGRPGTGPLTGLLIGPLSRDTRWLG
ncbi:MAG: hypothetical protein AAGB04_00750 [Pseudomonadota bacterium]